MSDSRLSTTMRIEIPPELRDGAKKGTVPASAVRKKIIRKVSSKKTDSGAIRVSQAAAVEDPEFQQLFQSVYDAAIITSLRGDIMDANIRAEEFFHCQREEFAQHNVLSLISGAEEIQLLDQIRANLEGNLFTLVELAYCQRFDGSFFPAEISVNRLQLTGHDFLCFFVRDITNRRQTEAMVRTVHNAIQNSGNGIAITDTEGRLEYINPAALRLWGYEIKDKTLLGRTVEELWEDPAMVETLVQRLLKGEFWVGELTARRSDGQTFPLQVSAAVNRDTDDELAGMVFSFVDISDRIRAAEMEREAERQRVMLESIGTACHHLGQPATVLLASLGMMQKREAAIDEEMRDLLHQGIASAEKLQVILHRLNTINEYRTIQYLDSDADRKETDGDRILQL